MTPWEQDAEAQRLLDEAMKAMSPAEGKIDRARVKELLQKAIQLGSMRALDQYQLFFHSPSGKKKI